MFRSREYNKEKRKEEKENKKKNWYKGKSGKQYDSVIFIPATPNSTLKKEVEKIATQTGLKVKVVENAGQRMVDYLKTFDKTTRSSKCMEKDCMVCKSEKGGPCRKSNIVYKISCKECLAEKIMANYFGEFNFNGFTRGKQHFEKYMSENKETRDL